MSAYGWIITQDQVSTPDEKSAVGVLGPRNITPAIQARLVALLKLSAILMPPAMAAQGVVPFRMYDDDGEFYYAGLMMGDDLQLFEPLDDYGTPNAGATRIDVYEKGRWVIV